MNEGQHREFRTYYQSLSPEAKKALAARARTSVNYLNQIVCGHRRAGSSISCRLVEADPNITFEMMRSAMAA